LHAHLIGNAVAEAERVAGRVGQAGHGCGEGIELGTEFVICGLCGRVYFCVYDGDVDCHLLVLPGN